MLGAYHGRGKRTSVYGAFLLACYNPSTETYETVCNIGTGFSEAVLEELHTSLSEIVIDRPEPFYSHSSVASINPMSRFEPRYVWEVKTADLTLSPRYKAGMKEGVDPAARRASVYVSRVSSRFVMIRSQTRQPPAARWPRCTASRESVTKSKGPAVDDDFEY